MHYIATHIEEISENGADMMHLGVVHGPNVTAGASRGYNEGWMSRLLTHHWKGNWEPKTESQRYGILEQTCGRIRLGMRKNKTGSEGG